MSRTTEFTWSFSTYTDAGVSYSFITPSYSDPATISSSASNLLANATGTIAGGVYTSKASAISTSSAIATATGSGSFTYIGITGTVHFMIPYSYQVDLKTNTPGKAEGTYENWFIIDAFKGEILDQAVTVKRHNGGHLYYSTLLNPEYFNFDVELTNGETYDFEFGSLAAAKAEVPLPAAFWFLGSGLIGLVGIRRKRV
jgi:hypothetical protein